MSIVDYRFTSMLTDATVEGFIIDLTNKTTRTKIPPLPRCYRERNLFSFETKFSNKVHFSESDGNLERKFIAHHWGGVGFFFGDAMDMKCHGLSTLSRKLNSEK